jgi:hypothetical protein
MQTRSIIQARAFHRTALHLLAVAAALGAAGCDSSGPGNNGGNTKPPSELTILTLAQNTPPLVADSVGFWAVYDQDREVRIDIAPNVDYLKFKVDRFGLLRRPDGTLFGPGDSIFISVKVINPDELLFEFSPAGLKFNPANPAELSIDYDSVGFTVPGDYDGDGDDDAIDAEIETDLAIWKQEAPGELFSRLTGFIEFELDEIEVKITSFTRYALAY